jgi:hypothetical protein
VIGASRNCEGQSGGHGGRTALGWVVGAVLALASVAGCAAGDFGHRPSGAESGRGDGAATDAVSTSPEAVVLTYLHALDRHDSGAARRQLAPGYAKQVEQEADSPFQNWLHLSDIRITQPAGSALGAENDPNVVELQAGFRLEQRDEVSMSNGGHLWWFTLRREPGAGRWLIVDEGGAP